MADILTDNEIFFKEWEPKLQNRFYMYIEDGASSIPAFIIKAADRPKLDNGQVVIDHINVERKLKGKSRWQDISITLYDPITPSGARSVMDWVRLGHESVTGRNGYSDMYKKNIKMHSISPPGEKIEEWIIKGAYINSVDFGQMDWASDSAVEISCTISYDYAVLNY